MGWWWRIRKKKRISARGAKLLEDLIECCDGKSNPIKFFSSDEIRKATDDFSKSSRISKVLGGFSEYSMRWYSGKIENHCKILVRDKDINVDEDICRDIAVSSMVSGHKNFLKFVGCCLEFEFPVMVYGAVKKHYILDISEQTWKRRMKIAEDIATALAYLHTAFPRPFVYRCMSLDNIFLDEDGDAKLTDFSCCVSIPEGETSVQVDRVVGAYLDYKYIMYGVVSEETDVFAIGMLMLRFLMGQKRFWNRDVCEKEEEAYGEGNDDNDSETMRSSAYPFYFKWFKFMEKQRIEEIADPEMTEKMVGKISELELCQMKAFLMLSLRCVGHKGEIPTMVEVAKELKKIQQTSLITDEYSSSPSGETPQLNSPQDVPSTVLLANQTTNTKPLLTCIACLEVFHQMFQWVLLSWFRFLRKKPRMC
ncbi:PREDICTED: inactive serine/threonine-protein kinase At1g67470-like [Camelina sativa]|uniref:Inactive serine/threonine-protein kinase At1g67470-like n=1 Tax=Camelina sativa TaxID=90675 RepID=A0ABM0UVC6_CAMSA|nr:PREDICTED: inactive serine/threonine-protein kinase At1g67470-like [Camelina sativa]